MECMNAQWPANRVLPTRYQCTLDALSTLFLSVALRLVTPDSAQYITCAVADDALLVSDASGAPGRSLLRCCSWSLESMLPMRFFYPDNRLSSSIDGIIRGQLGRGTLETAAARCSSHVYINTTASPRTNLQ